jgi:hypothetical protein
MSVRSVSGASNLDPKTYHTYETWMKHEVDRAGYAQTQRAPLCNVHMRQRCLAA